MIAGGFAVRLVTIGAGWQWDSWRIVWIINFDMMWKELQAYCRRCCWPSTNFMRRGAVAQLALRRRHSITVRFTNLCQFIFVGLRAEAVVLSPCQAYAGAQLIFVGLRAEALLQNRCHAHDRAYR